MKTIRTKLLLASWFLTGLANGSTLAQMSTVGSVTGPYGTLALVRTNAGLRASQPNNQVAFGQGIFVAVDGHDCFLTSSDGRTWTRQATGSPFALYAVVFAHGLFVAVGNEGAIVTSPDGANWTMQNSSTDERLRGVAWGNGRFAAVGYAGTVVTSNDGIRWTRQYCETEERLLDIAFGNGVFVAVGRHGAIVTSRKGYFWKKRKSGTSNELVRVSYSGSTFSATGPHETLVTSLTGRTWVCGAPETGRQLSYQEQASTTSRLAALGLSSKTTQSHPRLLRLRKFPAQPQKNLLWSDPFHPSLGALLIEPQNMKATAPRYQKIHQTGWRLNSACLAAAGTHWVFARRLLLALLACMTRLSLQTQTATT